MEEMSIRIGDAEIKIYYTRKDFSYRNVWDESVHFHIYNEIHLIKSGNVSLIADKTRLNLKSGDVFFLSPNVSHYTEGHNDELSVYSLLFNIVKVYDKDKIADGFSEFSHYNGILKANKGCMVINNPKLIDIFGEIGECGEAQEKTHIIKILFALFFVEFFRSLGKNKNVKNFQAAEDYESTEGVRQKRIIEDFFQNRYDGKVTINDLADELFLSASQTGRIVKKIFGMSFKRVLLKQRIENACMLIDKSDMSFDSVAEKSGYSSYNGFFFAFKKYTGLTPEEYKKKRP